MDSRIIKILPSIPNSNLRTVKHRLWSIYIWKFLLNKLENNFRGQKNILQSGHRLKKKKTKRTSKNKNAIIEI